MVNIVVFLCIFILMGIVDIRSMIKFKAMKEIVPYFLLMILSGVVGILYLTDPYRRSIASFLLFIFNIQG